VRDSFGGNRRAEIRSGGCPEFLMTSKEQAYAICVAVSSSCIAAALCELALLMIVAMIRSRTIALQLRFCGLSRRNKWHKVGKSRCRQKWQQQQEFLKKLERAKREAGNGSASGRSKAQTRFARGKHLPCFPSLPYLPLLALTSFFFVSFASASSFAFAYRANFPSSLHPSKVRCPCPPFLDKNESMSSFESESVCLCFGSPRIRGGVDRIVYRQRRRDSGSSPFSLLCWILPGRLESYSNGTQQSSPPESRMTFIMYLAVLE
jgi:hypothetical protein